METLVVTSTNPLIVSGIDQGEVIVLPTPQPPTAPQASRINLRELTLKKLEERAHASILEACNNGEFTCILYEVASHNVDYLIDYINLTFELKGVETTHYTLFGVDKHKIVATW